MIIAVKKLFCVVNDAFYILFIDNLRNVKLVMS